MPKLPAKYFYTIFILIFVVFGVLAAYLLYKQSHPATTPTYKGAPPTSQTTSSQVNGFNGTVSTVDVGKKQLTLVKGDDGKTYPIALSSSGKVQKNGQEVTFDSIKVGSSINVYSEHAAALATSDTFNVDFISISVKIDPTTLKPIE